MTLITSDSNSDNDSDSDSNSDSDNDSDSNSGIDSNRLRIYFLTHIYKNQYTRIYKLFDY